MMNHDDDLDRALFNLPLAEPPSGLRASILALTIYAPQPILRTWETVGIGVTLAMLVWLLIYVSTSGGPIAHLAASTGQALVSALADRHTLLWLGAGGLAAMLIAFIDVRPAALRRS